MLAEIKSIHREIIRLKFENRSTAEIAEATGYSERAINACLRDPLAQAALQKLQDLADGAVVDVRRRLAELNSKALDTLEHCLTADDVPHNVSLRAAQDVLDRNGYVPHQKVSHTHMHLTPDDLIGIKERAKSAGMIIEDPTEVADFEEIL